MDESIVHSDKRESLRFRSWLIHSAEHEKDLRWPKFPIIETILDLNSPGVRFIDSGIALRQGEICLEIYSGNVVWERFLNTCPSCEDSPMLAFTTVSASILDRFLGTREIVFEWNGRFLKCRRADPNSLKDYARFGAYAGRFLKFFTVRSHSCPTQFAVNVTKPESLVEDSSSVGKVYWNPLELYSTASSEELWLSHLRNGEFPNQEKAFFLPPWANDSSKIEYFEEDRREIRKEIRQILGSGKPRDQEPLAMILWRLTDNRRFLPWLTEGGELDIGNSGKGEWGEDVTTAINLKLSNSTGQGGNAIVDYRNEFLMLSYDSGKNYSWSRFAQEIAAAVWDDLENEVRPAELRISRLPQNAVSHSWNGLGCSTTTRRERNNRNDFLMKLWSDRIGSAIHSGSRDRFRIDMHDFQSFNLSLDGWVRHYWQPTARRLVAGRDENFWRYDVLVVAGLLENELHGETRDFSDRLEHLGHGVEVGTFPDGWDVSIQPEAVNADELFMLAALLMPVGTRIAVGPLNFVLDQATSLLDRDLLS